MIITSEQRVVLDKYAPDTIQYVEKDDLGEFLTALDDHIVDDILANNDEPSEIGIKLQRVYDQIYNQN